MMSGLGLFLIQQIIEGSNNIPTKSLGWKTLSYAGNGYKDL